MHMGTYVCMNVEYNYTLHTYVSFWVYNIYNIIYPKFYLFILFICVIFENNGDQSWGKGTLGTSSKVYPAHGTVEKECLALTIYGEKLKRIIIKLSFLK